MELELFNDDIYHSEHISCPAWIKYWSFISQCLLYTSMRKFWLHHKFIQIILAQINWNVFRRVLCTITQPCFSKWLGTEDILTQWYKWTMANEWVNKGKWINSLRPRRDRSHFADDIFNCILESLESYHLPSKVWGKITCCNPLSLVMDKAFHPTLYNGFYYLIHAGIKVKPC